MLHPTMITAHTGTGASTSHSITEPKKSSFGTKHRTAGIPHYLIGTLHQPFPLTRSRKKILPIQALTHHISKHRSKPKTHTPSPTCWDKLQAPLFLHLNKLEEGKSDFPTITWAIEQNHRSSFSNASFSSQQNRTDIKTIQTKSLWSSHA